MLPYSTSTLPRTGGARYNKAAAKSRLSRIETDVLNNFKVLGVTARPLSGYERLKVLHGEQYKKWSYDSLPILPQEWKYTVAADKEKQFKTLKELMHRADVSEVVNACDAGREGELIFRFVYEMAGCKKPMRRLWISSMEDSAIKEGFSRLKNGEEYDALFASALCSPRFSRLSYLLKSPPIK